MRRSSGIAAFTILLFALTTMLSPASAFEADATVVVTRVIDGDTFDTSDDRIRLADVNTPEVGDPGYSEAKSALSAMIGGKEVLLDVDDIHEVDTTGTRLVCVVYFRHNQTHLANVNKFLLDGGYAEVDDHDNEFNPNTWTSYEYYPVGSRTGPQTGPVPDLIVVTLVLAVMIIVIAVVAVILRSGRRRVAR